jgi:hypothetical protein
VRDRPDSFRMVPLRTDDPRVRRPVVSNVEVAAGATRV